jgi:hypothetical protein
LSERLDAADAAIVGRVVHELEGDRSRSLTVEVVQRVKGDVPSRIGVRTPVRTSCDLPQSFDDTVGLLLTKGKDGGLWEANLCSLVSPGELVAEGGEPRGGAIKVGIGIVILGLVLLWALRRLKRGARPDLPGAPRP